MNRKYYANCSTDGKILIVGPFEDILTVTEYGFKWSVANNHEPRWHVIYCKDSDCIVEQLTPDQGLAMISNVT